MRSLILILGLFLGSLSFAQTKPLHHIFFIHGIGGNAETFGAMPEATAYHLNMLDQSQTYKVYRFVYKTADQVLDSDDFALQFGQFIQSRLDGAGQPLAINDKISIVAHSQGGLVATIWYFHSYLQYLSLSQGLPIPTTNGKKGNYFPEYSQHMDAILTIGTPFWGSKLATLLIDDTAVSKVAQTVGKGVIEKMGRSQLEEMALGSRTIINFRKNVLKFPTALLEKMREKIRPANIAGAARLDELFANKTYGLSSLLAGLQKYTFGGKYFESDIAVSVPSAHFDSIYTIDHTANYIDGQITPLNDQHTHRTDFAPLTILNTIHASPWADEVYDMAYVPQKCLTYRLCNHPTFKYVIDHMLGKPLPKYGPGIAADELAGFIASVRVNLPEGVDAKDVKIITEKITDEKAEKDVEIVMANAREFMSNYDFYHPTQKNVLFRTFTGHLNYTNDGVTYDGFLARKKGVNVRLLIYAKGYKARYVDTTLQPTFSTYIEVTLEKK